MTERRSPPGTTKRVTPSGSTKRVTPSGSTKRGTPSGTTKRGTPSGTAKRGMREAKKKPEHELSRAALEEAALRYLDRFDCTATRLRSVLARRIAPGTDSALRQQVKTWIEELVARYQSSGLLDDRRFAQGFAERLRERGTSRRAIELKLRARGVDSETIGAVSAGAAPGDELAAAQAFAKRRRLGPHRPAAQRAEKRLKDLAALARAGFSHDTALRAIGHAPSGDDDL